MDAATPVPRDQPASLARSARRGVLLAGVLCAAAAAWIPTLATTAPTAEDIDNVWTVTRVVGVAVQVAGGLWWLPWFRAVLAPVRDRGLTRWGAWSFWGWIVPVANYVIPMLIVRDVWRAGDRPGRRDRLPWPVRIWWALWVASHVALLWFVLVHGDSDSIAGAVLYTGGLAVCTPFAIATIILLTRRAAALPETPANDGTLG